MPPTPYEIQHSTCYAGECSRTAAESETRSFEGTGAHLHAVGAGKQSEKDAHEGRATKALVARAIEATFGMAAMMCSESWITSGMRAGNGACLVTHLRAMHQAPQ